MDQEHIDEIRQEEANEARKEALGLADFDIIFTNEELKKLLFKAIDLDRGTMFDYLCDYLTEEHNITDADEMDIAYEKLYSALYDLIDSI